MNREWKRTSYDTPPELFRALNTYCAHKNITKSMLVNTFFLALLSGDIKIDYNENMLLKSKFDISRGDYDLFKLDLKDRDGNIINKREEINYGEALD